MFANLKQSASHSVQWFCTFSTREGPTLCKSTVASRGVTLRVFDVLPPPVIQSNMNGFSAGPPSVSEQGGRVATLAVQLDSDGGSIVLVVIRSSTKMHYIPQDNSWRRS